MRNEIFHQIGWIATNLVIGRKVTRGASLTLLYIHTIHHDALNIDSVYLGLLQWSCGGRVQHVLHETRTLPRLVENGP